MSVARRSRMFKTSHTQEIKSNCDNWPVNLLYVTHVDVYSLHLAACIKDEMHLNRSVTHRGWLQERSCVFIYAAGVGVLFLAACITIKLHLKNYEYRKQGAVVCSPLGAFRYSNKVTADMIVISAVG